MELGQPNLQGAYDAGTGAVPTILLDSTRNGVILRDAATPIGSTLFAVQQSGGASVFDVQSAEMSIGPTGRRLFRPNWTDTTGRYGCEVFPDDFSITTATGQTNSVFYSLAGRTITMNIPAGGGLGNDTAPGFVQFNHTARFEDQGFLFGSQLLVNAAVRVEIANSVTVGPLYLFLDQYKTYADGGSATCTQHNAMRAQPSWGPNINGGSITQNSAELYYAFCAVDGTVGTATVTTMNYFAAKAPNLVAGGTIGTLTVLDIVDIPAAGITTITGINSAMNNGTFIRQSGTAPSRFSGDLRVDDSVLVRFGTTEGVQFSRPFAGTLRQVGWGGTNNEGLDWSHDANPNNIYVTSPTGAGFNFDLIQMAIGPTGGALADGTSNWFFAFAPGLRATKLAGDYSECLWSSASAISVVHAISNFATWTINAPTISLGGGSIVNAANLLVQTNMAQGTNRYGLLVTSSPSGGTLNYCARFSGAAGVRIDGVFEHTGSTFGIFGTTPTTQPAAYTPTNVTTDRAYNANSTTIDELADVLGTLIADLQSLGIIG